MTPTPDSRVAPEYAVDGVSETLLISLAARARGSRSRILGGFHDEAAERLSERLELNLEHYAASPGSVRGIVARGMWFDERVLRFLTRYPSALVVSLGSGLNTMYERARRRVPGGEWRWLDTDLPDVIEMRKGLCPDDDRRTSAALDLTRDDWPALDSIGRENPLLVVAEGVLMYLREREVARVFRRLAALGSGRPECRVAFDWCSPLMSRHTRRHPAMRPMADKTVVFQWSMRRSSVIESYEPSWRVVHESSAPMTKAGLGPTLFAAAHYVLTGGGRFYACAEALLGRPKGART
jgi:O-methyltransferase involved in polyketide biosynthesis